MPLEIKRYNIVKGVIKQNENGHWVNQQSVTSLELRIKELERICVESYQVIGCLSDRLESVSIEVDVEKALDNLSCASLVHEDVLPFNV